MTQDKDFGNGSVQRKVSSRSEPVYVCMKCNTEADFEATGNMGKLFSKCCGAKITVYN